MSVVDKVIYNHYKDPVVWQSPDENGRLEYLGYAEKETLPHEAKFTIFHYIYEGDSYQMGPVTPKTGFDAVWDDRADPETIYYPTGY